MGIDHLKFSYEQSGVEATGPFHYTHYTLTVNGYIVPHLVANLMKGTENMWTLFLDNRFGHDVTDEELHQIIPLFANAMAIAAGFTHHGEGAKLHNRYQSPGGDPLVFIGEIREAYYPLLYEGQPLPYLKARPIPERPGYWEIDLDDRFRYVIAEVTLSHAVWLLAMAMAVAAGYSCFAPHSAPMNLYRCSLVGISTASTEQPESQKSDG